MNDAPDTREPLCRDAQGPRDGQDGPDAAGAGNGAGEFRRLGDDRLRLLVDALPVLIAYVGSDQRYHFTNRAYEEWFGPCPGGRPGKHVRDVLGDEAYRAIEAPLRAALAGQRVSYETLVPYRDGGRRFIHADYVPDRDESGEVLGFFSLVRDVTESKSQEALLEGEERVLELIARGVPLGEALDALARLIERQSPGLLCSVLLLDADGVRLRHGSAPGLPAAYCRAVDGVAIGPAVGSCGTAAWRREAVVVTDIAADPLWEGYRELALSHGLRACWSTPICSANGVVLGTFAVYYREPRGPGPQERELIARATHVAGIAIERHRAGEALRQSEATYRALVETTGTGYVILDGSGRALDANAEYVRLTGHRSLDEIRGRCVTEWTAEHDRQRNSAEIRRCSAQGYVRNLEIDYVDREGRVTPLEVNGTAFESEDGPRIIGLCRDISERRGAEARLQEYADRLRGLSHRLMEAQEQERRHLSRELHDEVGQLLTALDLALRRSGDGREPADLSQARALVRDLTDRVRDLSLRLRPAMLDDLGLPAALLWLVERYSAQTGVRVELRHHGLGGRFRREVETAAYRLVQEALTNVARHAGVKEAAVGLWASGGRLVIQVEDQGKGFRPGEAPARATSSGLAGMRERVRLLEGSLEIDSEPDRGTCLTVELPAPEADEEDLGPSGRKGE